MDVAEPFDCSIRIWFLDSMLGALRRPNDKNLVAGDESKRGNVQMFAR